LPPPKAAANPAGGPTARRLVVSETAGRTAFRTCPLNSFTGYAESRQAEALVPPPCLRRFCKQATRPAVPPPYCPSTCLNSSRNSSPASWSTPSIKSSSCLSFFFLSVVASSKEDSSSLLLFFFLCCCRVCRVSAIEFSSEPDRAAVAMNAIFL